MRALAVVSAVVLALVGAATAAGPQDKPVPVRIAIAAPAKNAGEIRATGTLLFKREMTLGFKVNGILKSFVAESGDGAKKNELLALLDPTEVGARQRDAQAAFENAEINLKRIEDLAAKGFASKARLDDARMAAARAKATRDAAGFDAAKAELRAPEDGVVLSRLAEPNEVVTPGKPILLFGDASSGLVVVTPVSDTQITRIRGGDAAEVIFAGLAPMKASVTRLAAKADQRTGSFDVELKLAELKPGLRSGLVGDARISPSVNDRTSGYLAIPAIALLEGRGDQAAVFVVGTTGKARRQSVRVAGFLDDMVLIAEGLSPGDRVVTSGAPYLRNGQAVVIVRETDGVPAS